MEKTLIRSAGRRPQGGPTRSSCRSVAGFAVKGKACQQPNEVLISARLIGPAVLGISYQSERQVPVRKNARKTRRQKVIRTVLCNKHTMPNGDFFWMAATVSIHKIGG